MNESEMKQIFDVIFMMVASFVIVVSIVYGTYKGMSLALKKHRKSKILNTMQSYVNTGQFQNIITFDHEGLPILVEIIENKKKKIIAL